MSRSRVVYQNGIPALDIEGRTVPTLAYMTYFEERNDYAAVAGEGVELFTVSLSIGNQALNTTTGCIPQTGGIFSEKGKPNFEIADRSIRQIVEACPNACIFPRVFLCMPQWWIDENPTEVTDVAYGKRREALYSRKYREDAARMLTELIEHFRQSPFADNIVGYHVAGGNTEEWFHCDLRGSYCENALPYFNEYRAARAQAPVSALPDLDGYENSVLVSDPILQEYLRFASECVADTVEYICQAAKRAVNHEQVIGIFYGYCWGIPHALWGSHALEKLLDSSHIDFISSPCAYWDNRQPGRDWPEQFPVDSVKLHGKMCFIEADIRTNRSIYPGQARAGFDPDHKYDVPVFLGPSTEKVSAAVMRKTVAQQLTKGHGMWWFDMFGHWYNTPTLMREIRLSKKLYSQPRKGYDYMAQVALFVDERMYALLGMKHPFRRLGNSMYDVLGKVGAPIHYYLLSDVTRLDWSCGAYRAALIMAPEQTEAVGQAVRLLTEQGVAVQCITQAQTVTQMREFLRGAGVFILCESDDVVYIGNGYLGLHTATAGEKVICLPERLCCEDMADGQTVCTERLTLACEALETRLFHIKKDTLD